MIPFLYFIFFIYYDIRQNRRDIATPVLLRLCYFLWASIAEALITND